MKIQTVALKFSTNMQRSPGKLDHSHVARWILAAIVLSHLPVLSASDLDEFKIKREEIFEFTQKPELIRDGDQISIAFEAKGLCDCTIAIEDRRGKIIRHLASGVLGKNAPEPFQKDSKKQTIVWDSKDDQDRYVDDLNGVVVRVSLGLKPRFEKTLFWEPKKRWSPWNPLIRATAEGVYVFDNGGGMPHLRLFGHDGAYLRTVYPFPADRLKQVNGLHWKKFPQDGKELPLKRGYIQSTFLSCGTNSHFKDVGYGPSIITRGPSYNASAMAIQGKRIALAHLRLNRLATDGTSGGLPLPGPEVSFTSSSMQVDHGRKPILVEPTSLAFSPDEKWLYLSGYCHTIYRDWDTYHAVMRMPFDGSQPPKLFMGSIKRDGFGRDNKNFDVAACVACDAKGRVYVGDHMNNRIQVYDPEGRHLKTIQVKRPAQIVINPKSGDLFVFSWTVYNSRLLRTYTKRDKEKGKKIEKLQPTLTHLGPFRNPALKASYTLPLPAYSGFENQSWHAKGVLYSADIDFWADAPVIWVGGQGAKGYSYAYNRWDKTSWDSVGIKLLTIREKNVEILKDFGRETAASVTRAKPPTWFQQKMYVNPLSGKLYLNEGGDAAPVNRGCKELLEIDPDTGKVRPFKLPMEVEDVTFDTNGLIYLRRFTAVCRYDPQIWREVPWDYGEQRIFKGGGETPVISALAIPCLRRNHQGGLWVSPRGHMAVSSYTSAFKTDRRSYFRDKIHAKGKSYTHSMYPGKYPFGIITVWDKHGKLLYDDAVPGFTWTMGLGIDKDDNIYGMYHGTRFMDGKRYFNSLTGTLIKFKPGKGRALSSTHKMPVPLGEADRPKRPFDLEGKKMSRVWVEDAEWFYGGVGWNGRGRESPGSGCDCWNTRFMIDYFERSFAPETDHCSVAVLDTNGNLVLRLGRYGNVDEGKPLQAAGGPSTTRSIGGDEVSLNYSTYVATHTDRRLFIADQGNHRLLSVKLGYHAEERMALKDLLEGDRK